LLGKQEQDERSMHVSSQNLHCLHIWSGTWPPNAPHLETILDAVVQTSPNFLSCSVSIVPLSILLDIAKSIIYRNIAGAAMHLGFGLVGVGGWARATSLSSWLLDAIGRQGHLRTATTTTCLFCA
jgi:hypothetical protein